MKSNNLSIWRDTVVWSMATILLLVAQISQAQTCSDNIKKSVPDTRYTLLADGKEVLDKTTDLVWKRCPEGLSGDDCNIGTTVTYSWSQALALADNTWRLPDVKELASLVEIACYNPAINLTLFPSTSGDGFWSSSPSASDVSFASGVAFISGAANAWGKYNNFYVRLVRSGK